MHVLHERPPLLFPKIFSLLGNPVVSMPIGFTPNDLPIGVQVVGARWRDAHLLVVAKQLFDAAGRYRFPSGYGNPIVP